MELMTYLEKWHDSLLASFYPTAHTRRLGRASPGELSFNIFEQIWVELPLFAATVQSYHQAGYCYWQMRYFLGLNRGFWRI